MSKNKIHVLQVTGTMNRGGAEIMLMDIYRNLSSDTKFDFLIQVKKNNPTPTGDFDNEILKLGGRLRHIQTQWDLGPLKYISQFKKIIHDIGTPDVVHIHLNAKCGIIALAAKLCGIKKIIAHCHGDKLIPPGSFFKVFPNIVELKLQRLLISMFATDFWGCSNKACDSLFIKNNKLIINNAIDVNKFCNVSDFRSKILRNSYGANKDTFVIGNVGRIIPRKKVDFIIEILNSLSKKDMDYIFVFVGRVDNQSYMEDILIKIKKYGLTERVIYLGDQDNIPEILSTFDIFVSPAQDEAFGMVAAEAQASGLPCILSTGYPRKVDMDLNLVTFLNHYEPNSWSDAILQAKGKKITDRELIYKHFNNLGFDAAENTRRIEQLYRSSSVTSGE